VSSKNVCGKFCEYSEKVSWKDKRIGEFIMVAEVATQRKDLKEVIEKIVGKLSSEFPDAEFLLEGETYSDEDAIIKIYAPSDNLNSISDKATELSLNSELEDGYFILTIVNSIEAYPIA